MVTQKPTSQTGLRGLGRLVREPALLVLEDGRLFRGLSYGAVGETVGEAVFSTGMTGYQETLTDPSYHRQVIVMTAPHVGNTGVNDEDGESHRIWAAGYVVRDPALRSSNWRASSGSARSTRGRSPATCASEGRCGSASSVGRRPSVRSPSCSTSCVRPR